MFHVGQKVVCIDDRWPHTQWALKVPNKPVAGRVYTIREVYLSALGKPAVLLNEIRNSPRPFLHGLIVGEGSFHSRRFKPVIERKTDISIFTRMLTDKHATERV